MKLKNESKLTLGFCVGIKHNEEPTVTGLLQPDKSVIIPDEDILIIKDATLRTQEKHKVYTKEEVEKFMEDDFIDFEDEEIDNAIKTIATRQEVTMEVENLPFENKEERGELIIRIKLYSN